MKRMLASVILSVISFDACGGASTAQSGAQKMAAALTGDDNEAAGNPQCKLFTPAELAKYIGEPLSAGHNALGGCQWLSTKTRADGSQGDVMITVVPARYHERPTRATGFKEVPDVGVKGFVALDFGGWAAGAIVGKDAVRVTVDGAAAGETSAVALLKETVRRLGSS
jgi:hypothetical protein